MSEAAYQCQVIPNTAFGYFGLMWKQKENCVYEVFWLLLIPLPLPDTAGIWGQSFCAVLCIAGCDAAPLASTVSQILRFFNVKMFTFITQLLEPPASILCPN